MPRRVRHPRISTQLERRIRRARKTVKAREFELMLALRPERPSVVAEGDSWFAYPPPNLAGLDDRSNLINWLSRATPLNLLQLSSNGDEAVSMLSGPSKHRLISVLQRFDIDFLLFSGGGNDIVGRHDMDYLLRGETLSAGAPLEACLHLERVNRRLTLIELAYAELIDFCKTFSKNPDIRVITHCYDYPLPSAHGARFLGGILRLDNARSWMYPALMRKGIPEDRHGDIARWLIDQLAERLLGLEDRSDGLLSVVDTRGIVDADQWVNEIHPDRAGFARLGAAMLATMADMDERIMPAISERDR